jgi:hypothetical protein
MVLIWQVNTIAGSPVKGASQRCGYSFSSLLAVGEVELDLPKR